MKRTFLGIIIVAVSVCDLPVEFCSWHIIIQVMIFSFLLLVMANPPGSEKQSLLIRLLDAVKQVTETFTSDKKSSRCLYKSVN